MLALPFPGIPFPPPSPSGSVAMNEQNPMVLAARALDVIQADMAGRHIKRMADVAVALIEQGEKDDIQAVFRAMRIEDEVVRLTKQRAAEREQEARDGE